MKISSPSPVNFERACDNTILSAFLPAHISCFFALVCQTVEMKVIQDSFRLFVSHCWHREKIRFFLKFSSEIGCQRVELICYMLDVCFPA